MSANKIIHRTIGDLTPYKNNPRTHTRDQIRQIARSIEEFGWTNPVLIDRGDVIIAGHGRIEAAKLLGLEAVPTICLEDLGEAQKRAYIIADNKLAEKAGWDEDLLAIEFEGLMELETDLTLTGFEIGEIDLILGHDEGSEEEVAPLPSPDDPVISQAGDLWLCGPHRILCGDARDPAAYRQLLVDDQADLVFTDPPYNVPIDGHVCGKGSIRHEAFAMASGEMSPAEFESFLDEICSNLVRHSRPGSLHFVCMDWRHTRELLTIGERHFTELKNICVWNKSNAGMGSLYRSRHEFIVLFKHGREPHTNNIELGKHGRHRSNVWSYPGVNTFGKNRMKDLTLHPTVKPVRMIADAILDCSAPRELILDPFLGSGSTLLAAEQTGRHCRAMEIDGRYVDVALRRFEEATGIRPIHEATGLGPDEVAAMRKSGAGQQTKDGSGQQADSGAAAGGAQ